MASETKTLPFVDPTINWHVKPSLKHNKIITSNTPVAGAINYSCDDVICFPRFYGGYLRWRDPTNDQPGLFITHPEAWDHEHRVNPFTDYPYNGKAVIIPGYGGYFLAVTLTDDANIFQLNIIRRYLDDTILIYNTGKYGNNSSDIGTVVYDPPGGYNVMTNGYHSEDKWTALDPGEYVLYYKGPAPAVDAATGLFAKSPFGVSKSLPHELWTNAFTHTGLKINIPKMYLGVRAPNDMEIISNGTYPGAHSAYISSGASGSYGYPLLGWAGQDARRYIYGNDYYNTSYISGTPPPGPWIYKNDPNTTTWAGGHQLYGAWFGWGENENGDVKFILLSLFDISIDTNFKEIYRIYVAYIYDIERNEAYTTTIIKPTVTSFSYGELGSVAHPLFSQIVDAGSTGGSAFAYIDANDAWNKTTTAASTTWTYHDNAYGFCNYYSDKIICAEGLGIYTTDPDYTPPAPKSAFGAARYAGKIDALAPRVPSLGDRGLNAGQVYTVVTRLKTFPGTTSDTDLQNWFKSLQPKSLTSDDYNGILRALPGSFWLFGQIEESVNISCPSTIYTGSQFTVNVSCPARPNKSLWVALVDKNGNIVASNSGTTNSSGNASITLTAPNTTGTYRVLTIVKGDRQLV